VGLGRVGPSSHMADAEFVASGLEDLLVAGAVVGHDAIDPDAQAGVVGDGLAQELRAAERRLVGLYAGEGDPRVVVDGQMHCVPADAPLTARTIPGDAVADATDAPEAPRVGEEELSQSCALGAPPP